MVREADAQPNIFQLSLTEEEFFLIARVYLKLGQIPTGASFGSRSGNSIENETRLQ